MSTRDSEENSLSGRLSRYARVGANVGGVAARVAATRLFNRQGDDLSNAKALTEALGGLKGPIMKVAQLMATVPDALPPEYAEELQKLQSEAPPMGWAFVKRRMQSELGPGWESRFRSFDKTPAAAASLGQVHRAVSLGGEPLAVKLQYPDMQSAVEADLTQLQVLFALHRQMDTAINTSEIFKEIGARIREELDYGREAKHALLYADVLKDEPLVRVPGVHKELSTRRLLTLGWLTGNKLLTYKNHPQEDRNRISEAMFNAWWLPFSRYGVIHGDPHLGNYTVFEEDGRPGGINLLDYGCVRIFPIRFMGGVLDLYHGLLENDEARLVHAYETWGFKNLKKELVEVLNIWARFIYGPILDNRVRTIADGVKPGEYGRKEAFQVHKELKKKGPVTVPQEFVFMDRAAIGLGGVFLHLEARLNFYELFNRAIENVSLAGVERQQREALAAVGLTAAL
ncbi:MAG: AarF/ABC1/UbiB kinase family protein [Methylocystis sp.]|nr:AarF/ABC1/UbiB kinase family protein [Methylocystis sp.]MCA3583967.1 AarF/ABC1/UbiB kinase family protein [Methylocystis sp.]MCA3588930.1 AarF/ABC1/UbiB kinase family protein [Methylocystis sp.]MCA3592471.1 AarF/ABC1/UbiB kinase family protein [Methylocystis sp.]